MVLRNHSKLGVSGLRFFFCSCKISIPPFSVSLLCAKTSLCGGSYMYACVMHILPPFLLQLLKLVDVT